MLLNHIQYLLHDRKTIKFTLDFLVLIQQLLHIKTISGLISRFANLKELLLRLIVNLIDLLNSLSILFSFFLLLHHISIHLIDCIVEYLLYLAWSSRFTVEHQLIKILRVELLDGFEFLILKSFNGKLVK